LQASLCVSGFSLAGLWAYNVFVWICGCVNCALLCGCGCVFAVFFFPWLGLCAEELHASAAYIDVAMLFI
jgi:hypothetical protein